MLTTYAPCSLYVYFQVIKTYHSLHIYVQKMKEKCYLKLQPISMFKYHEGKNSLLKQKRSVDFMFIYHECKCSLSRQNRILGLSIYNEGTRSLLRQNRSLGFMFI